MRIELKYSDRSGNSIIDIIGDFSKWSTSSCLTWKRSSSTKSDISSNFISETTGDVFPLGEVSKVNIFCSDKKLGVNMAGLKLPKAMALKKLFFISIIKNHIILE